MLRVLNVAEKNEAAKGIAEILSNGRSQRREGFSKFNKIYEFDFNIQLFNVNAVRMVMTSVSGHLLNMDFGGAYRKWQGTPILTLFDAPIEKICEQNMEPIRRTLISEAKKAQHLIIWTDCDREGENIGFEIIEVCQEANRRLVIHRARFSEITRVGINRAIRTLAPPQKSVSDAVECRRELDLRIGAAFTRFQTLLAQKEFPDKLRESLISYGSCQFPTLGFVVERYKAAENFIPEPFWKLIVKHRKDEALVEFQWGRVKVFDKQVCETLLAVCRERPLAVVENVITKPKTKRRPVALETIVLEKSASRKLHISAKRTMDIAQKLYTKGFISYPRTETNKFPKDIDLRSLVALQIVDHQWGPFAQGLLNTGVNPHNGSKSDEAHPPIHPIRYANPQELQNDERRVYEFITRHFLACLSSDAQGKETTVDIDVAKEKFSVNGLVIIARNYLDVYPYDVWSDKVLPEYNVGEQFTPNAIEMNESQTTAPSLLTEADLIALMEKHGIGTDATHAEHIETIKDRRYVALNESSRFVPGFLGLGLVEGYDSMGYNMSKPNLRRELENDLKEICNGTKRKDDVLREQVNRYRTTFERAYNESRRLINALAAYFGGGSNNGTRDPPPNPPGGGRNNPPPFPPGGGDDHPRPPGGGFDHPRPPGGGFDYPRPSGGGFDHSRPLGSGFDHPRPPGGGFDHPRPPNFGNIRRDAPPPFSFNGNHPGSPPSPSPNCQQPIPSCNCGNEAVERTVKKAGPNEGRRFYCCAKSFGEPDKCNFFSWADGTSSNSERGTNENLGAETNFNRNDQRFEQAPPPLQRNQQQALCCNCGSEVAERTVKKAGPNEGRRFYCCSKLSDDQSKCNFFSWADGPSTSTINRNDGQNENGAGETYFNQSSASFNGDSRRQPVSKVTSGRGRGVKSVKTSFGVNHGADDLFPTNIQWNQSRNNNRGQSRGSSGGRGGGRKCSHCKQPGHTANKCPHKL